MNPSLHSAIRSPLSKAIALMVFTGNLLAVELQLIPDQSSLGYTAVKYGTMHVDGFLTESGKAGLSGRVLLEKSEVGFHVSGEINLERAAFDSQHARRDDEVSALFKTPMRLTLSSLDHSPCSPARGHCALNVDLELNGRTERFEQNVSFFRQQDILKAEGEFTIARQAFDLVFREGFAATLDVAVSSEIGIHFSLGFESSDLLIIERVPEDRVTTKDEPLKALDQRQENKPGFLDRVGEWLEGF
jgi:hypothetical protein